MKHPSYPPKPPCKPAGIPAPHIIACENRVIPCLCTVLKTNADLCWPTPLRLIKLLPGVETPHISITGEADACGHIPVCVTIPLCLTVLDARGHMHTLSSSVEVPTWLSRPCLWRQSLMTVADIQLLGESVSCQGLFEVRLHVALEFCLFQFGRASACPSLPLYPPPIRR